MSKKKYNEINWTDYFEVFGRLVMIVLILGLSERVFELSKYGFGARYIIPFTLIVWGFIPVFNLIYKARLEVKK